MLVGASIGRAALVTEKAVGGNVNQAVAVIRLVPKGLLPPLLVNWLLSPKGQYQIHAGKVEVARANLSLAEVGKIVVPLAPAREQGEVLAHLSEGMKFIRRLGDTIISLNSSLNTLDQSILTKAFHGELVPQDPNDEPASVLLERIREEKSRMNVQHKRNLKPEGGKIVDHKENNNAMFFQRGG